MRAFLIEQEKEWLIEQIVRLALDVHSLEEMDRRHMQEARARSRSERVARLREIGLNPQVLAAFLEDSERYSRERLTSREFLLDGVPARGTDLLEPRHRTAEGERLLRQAKDILFGLLFGDESTGCYFERDQRELLVLALPRFKAGALDFMKASTEYRAAGTWQDPTSVSNDARADNVILEVEFGEIRGELIGRGIVRCLSLINNLEVNEQVLYARMIDVEQSTLIE